MGIQRNVPAGEGIEELLLIKVLVSSLGSVRSHSIRDEKAFLFVQEPCDRAAS
jgi:hypothetical protein